MLSSPQKNVPFLLKRKYLSTCRYMPQMISNISYTPLKVLLERFKCKCRRNKNVHSQHSVCGHAINYCIAICVLWSIAFVAVTGPIILAITTILIYLFVSVACIIIFSPYVWLMLITFRFIRKQFISRVSYF